MSMWTRIVFEPKEGATVESLEAALTDACADPETYSQDGRLIWKEAWSFDIGRIRNMDVPAARILVTRCEDTAGTGTWYLFEPIDGEFVLVDSKAGGEHRYGEDAFDLLRLDHGVEGVWS